MLVSIAKWLAVAAVAILGVVLAWNLMSDDEPRDGAADDPVISDTAPPEATSSPAAAARDVQVLNGSADPAAGDRVKVKLEAAGYKIVLTGNAARNYDKSTIFFQEGFEDQAKDMAQFLAVSVTEPAPENLDKKIPLTVVIGSDYRS